MPERRGIDMKNLTKEDEEYLQNCYMEIYSSTNDILNKHYGNRPISPNMLNLIISPLYCTILDTMTEDIEKCHVRNGARILSAKDLTTNIMSLLQDKFKEEMELEKLK